MKKKTTEPDRSDGCLLEPSWAEREQLKSSPKAQGENVWKFQVTNILSQCENNSEKHVSPLCTRSINMRLNLPDGVLGKIWGGS